MNLYKYVAPSRTSILQNGLIRFTPPARFNDPFEMRPYYKALADEHDVNQVLAEQSMEDILKDELKLAYADVSDDVRRLVPVEFLSFFASAIAPSGVEAMPALLDTFSAGLRKPLTEGFNEHIGVLSLTEKADNLLMWAHYAQEHTGFVIEFDADNLFFHQRRGESDEFGYLRKVNYSMTRPNVVLTKVTSTEMFLTKSEDWRYEQEWRMLRPLKDATEVRENDEGESIHLYQVPGSCITKVIVGARMNEEKRHNIRRIISNNTELGHVKIFEAVLDEQQFKLNLVELKARESSSQL